MISRSENGKKREVRREEGRGEGKSVAQASRIPGLRIIPKAKFRRLTPASGTIQQAR